MAKRALPAERTDSAPRAEGEELLSLRELAARLPSVRRGRPVHKLTLYRWATVGLKSRSGQRVRLRTQFVGGTICSTLADVDRLAEQRNDIEYLPEPLSDEADRRDRRKRADAALARLRANGFY